MGGARGVAVAAGYLASTFLVGANPARLKPHEVMLGLNAASVGALLVLRSRGPFAAIAGASLVLRALSVAALAAAGRNDVNAFDPMTRWDSAAGALGIVLVVAALCREVLPRSRFRWAYDLVFLAVAVPLVGVLPKLLDLPRFDLPTVLAAARLSRDVTWGPEAASLYDAESDVSVLIVAPPRAGPTFVAFSSSRSAKNVKVDLNVGSKRIGAWLRKGGGGDVQPRVLAGIGEVFARLRPALLAKLAGRPHIACTGHSLGGGLATVAGLVLADAFPAARVDVYTFGSPATGDATFTAAFDAAVRDSVRVVDPMDPVPRGSATQFTHVRGYYPVASVRRDAMSQHWIDTYIAGLTGSARGTALGMLVPVGIALAALTPVVAADFLMR